MKQSSKKESVFVRVLRVCLIILLLPVVLLYLITNYVKKCKQKKENKDGIKIYKETQIDSLSGLDFEKLLLELFKKMGYEATLTKRSKDYGADLILVKNKQKIVVQAKCYSGTVGIKAVQEVIGAKNYYRATHALVVTNTGFSKEAISLGLEADVQLISREELLNLLIKYDVKIMVSRPAFSSLSKDAKLALEQKYKYWI